MKFGPLIKQLRINKQLTLRNFCQLQDLDPSNWSKIERGINLPPKDLMIIQGWADFFNLEGEQRQEFLDAAAVARQEIPSDLVNDEDIVAQLPAFFRVMRNAEPSDDKLKEFVEDLRRVNSPDSVVK